MPFFSFSWTEEPQTGNAGGARSRGKNMKDRRGQRQQGKLRVVVKLKFERQRHYRQRLSFGNG